MIVQLQTSRRFVSSSSVPASVACIDCMERYGCRRGRLRHSLHLSPDQARHFPARGGAQTSRPYQKLYIYGFIGTKNQGPHTVDLFIAMMNRRLTMCIVSVKLPALI